MIFERPKPNVCPETGVNYWIERIPFLPKKSDFQDIVSTFWLDLMTAGRAGVQRRTGAKVISLLFRRESHRCFCGCWVALLLDSSGNTKKSLWEKRRDCRSNMQLFENLWTCNELRVSLLSSIFFKWLGKTWTAWTFSLRSWGQDHGEGFWTSIWSVGPWS